jgi:hypothetical protein
LNRPERRLAVLALLANDWKKFSQLAKQGDPEKISEYFLKLAHPYWDHHYTVQSKRSENKITLVGEARIQSIFFNVIWPLGIFSQEQLIDWLRSIRRVQSNHPSRVASLRLLAKRKLNQPMNLLAQEGLLQIYKDFCMQDISHCASCSFPELIEKWK